MTDMAVQRDEARGLANTTRRERVALTHALRDGTTTLEQVLRDRPACVQNMMLWELLLRSRKVGREKLRKFNMLAVRDRVNLAVSVGGMSQRTVEWVVWAVERRAGER